MAPGQDGAHGRRSQPYGVAADLDGEELPEEVVGRAPSGRIENPPLIRAYKGQ
jgi:hypothetical protein